MDIVTQADRLRGLSALSRAAEVEGTHRNLPVAQMGRGGELLDVVAAQRVAVPRQHAQILQTVRTLAAAAGSDYFYRIPVRKKVKDEQTGKEEWVQSHIEGPSITLANDLAREYGNCAVRTRVVDIGDSWIIYAQFVDIERGYTLERPYQQRKSQKAVGTKDEDRQRDIAFQIGVSKAVRNVVVNALETFANYMYEEARTSVVDKLGKDMPRHRDRVLARLAEMQVDVRRVELVQGRASKDWLVTDVAAIIANIKAISEGMANADDCWPRLESYKKADGAGGVREETVDPETGEVIGGEEPTRGDAPPTSSAPVGSRSPEQNGGASQPGAAPGDIPSNAERAASDRSASGQDQQPPAQQEEAPPMMSDLLVSLLDQVKQVGRIDSLEIIRETAKDQLSSPELATFTHAAMLRERELGGGKRRR